MTQPPYGGQGGQPGPAWQQGQGPGGQPHGPQGQGGQPGWQQGHDQGGQPSWQQAQPVGAPGPGGSGAPGGPGAPGNGPRRRKPWVLPVAILGALTLVGVLVLGGGVAVVLLDPFGWKGEPTSRAETTSPTEDPSFAKGGTEDYSFSYPVEWATIEPTESPAEYSIYDLKGQDAENTTWFSVAESEAIGGDPIDVCWGIADSNDYVLQGDVELDGRVVKHLQNREPTSKGEPQVRDAWCAEGTSGSMLIIIGRSSGPAAADLEVSAPHVIIDSWKWSS